MYHMLKEGLEEYRQFNQMNNTEKDRQAISKSKVSTTTAKLAWGEAFNCSMFSYPYL